jgi:hypothetical protein
MRKWPVWVFTLQFLGFQIAILKPDFRLNNAFKIHYLLHRKHCVIPVKKNIRPTLFASYPMGTGGSLPEDKAAGA